MVMNILRSIVVGVTTSVLLVWWGLLPILTYSNGTSENITVTVLKEPFLNGDQLVYEWRGDVVRRCPVDIRRSITDSEGVVTNLVESTFNKPTVSILGPQTYQSTINVPARIPEGPAIYRAVEVPRCSILQRIRPVEVPYPEVHFTVTR